MDGEDYHFIDRAEFEERIAPDEFLEWAEVFGNYYGTHREVLEQAQEQGCDLVLDIDVQGAGQLKEDSGRGYRLYPGPVRARSWSNGCARAARIRKR